MKSGSWESSLAWGQVFWTCWVRGVFIKDLHQGAPVQAGPSHQAGTRKRRLLFTSCAWHSLHPWLLNDQISWPIFQSRVIISKRLRPIFWGQSHLIFFVIFFPPCIRHIRFHQRLAVMAQWHLSISPVSRVTFKNRSTFELIFRTEVVGPPLPGPNPGGLYPGHWCILSAFRTREAELLSLIWTRKEWIQLLAETIVLCNEYYYFIYFAGVHSQLCPGLTLGSASRDHPWQGAG